MPMRTNGIDEGKYRWMYDTPPCHGLSEIAHHQAKEISCERPHNIARIVVSESKTLSPGGASCT